MNAEIIEWSNLREQADKIIKQKLDDKQTPQERLKIAKALAVYVKSDHTVKTLQMNEKRTP